jgi:DNA-binding NarL/FixJ family response regulator
VLRAVAAGRTNQEVSEHLFISLNTVSYHLRNIFNKTGAANRTEAASFAHRHAILLGSSQDAR